MASYRTNYCIDANEKVGSKIKVAGWVDNVRDLGKVVFIMIRDITAPLQVVSKKGTSSFKTAKSLGRGDVVSIFGRVRKRSKETINPKIKTGEFELEAEDIQVINRSETLPIVLGRVALKEKTRLKYRYLDLRSERMQRNLILRSKIINSLREFYLSEGFIEIETPYLAKSTPEGSRDFLVPCRLQPGKFYALAQSPQLYKQLLMVSGFDRYFQIARCFRDEDLRGDRQPEFTQLDIEMSFVEQEDVMDIVERSVRHVFKQVLGVRLGKMPKLDYDEVIKRYGSDKPDLRIKGLEIISQKPVTLKVEEEYLKKLDKTKLSPKLKSIEDSHQVKINPDWKGGKIKVIGKEVEKIDKVWVERALAAASELRRYIAYSTSHIDRTFRALWIVNYPLFELDDQGNIVPAHHPFTCPADEDIPLLEKNPLKVKAKAYDLVINGWEVAGGSIRIHKPELQRRVFKILGMSEEEYMERYGFLIEAFKYGAPPHGGIAFGLDRFVAVMLGLESIRDTIAFPKTRGGADLLTESPSKAPEEYLRDLPWLKVKKIVCKNS